MLKREIERLIQGNVKNWRTNAQADRKLQPYAHSQHKREKRYCDVPFSISSTDRFPSKKKI